MNKVKLVNESPNEVIIEKDFSSTFDYPSEEEVRIDLGLANIYLIVYEDNKLHYSNIIPDNILNPFQKAFEVEDSFKEVKYKIKITFHNFVLFYDLQLISDSKKIIKVLFGQDLKLGLDNLKYPFLNNRIMTPPNGDTVIIGPLEGSNSYLQSGSLSNDVSYYTFKQKDQVNTHYLLESPWLDLRDYNKIIFYEKIIFDIISFFGEEINLSEIVKTYQSAK
ncbi:MAG TPA: hypothetical protein GXZ35_04615 [Acholeplasmataceae bacterium]|nr:hypothetical protein [Acholeplasmataceae bacterium]